jgi:DNA-binding CsgD family transcriptional regulator
MWAHTGLRGRDAELGALDRLLRAVRSGESRALVLCGEPGVGKTALLEHLSERASGYRMARAAGVHADMELPFAGLHLLCATMIDRLERLPDPQREALRTAFGLSAGRAPDPFLLRLAVLSLLSEVAMERPLVCLIDDAQWLDRASAQALSFVARRLQAESVGLVFAAREEHELAGLPELVIEGLGEDHARALLLAAVGVRLDEQAVDRIVAETRGNPSALLELPRGLSLGQLAGGFGLLDALPLSSGTEERFRRRLDALPTNSRRLLLIAAAEPVGDPAVVWRAVERLGIGVEVAAAVEHTGLCELGASVRFVHPLVRAAIHRAASPEERRAVHAALAAATDPELDPDRRAWHRAHATAGLDEEVAAELERSAGRAMSRGGVAAAAGFLEQAVRLTPTRTQRVERAIAAAQAKCQAGAFRAANGLLITAHAGAAEEHLRARVDLLRAQLAFAASRGREAPPRLLSAAERLEPLDTELARETYLDAFTAALFVGRQAEPDSVRRVADAAGAALPPLPRRARDLLLDGFARVVTDGYPAGAPVLQRALSAFRAEQMSDEACLHRFWLAGHAAAVLWDFATWQAFAVRHVELARDAGAVNVLPIALSTRTGVHLLAGEFGEATSLVAETATIGEATGSRVGNYGALPLAALQGREAVASRMIEAGTREAMERGEGLALLCIRHSSAVLHNGLGRYDEALAAADHPEHPAEPWSGFLLPELVEAAVRAGRLDRAHAGIQRLLERTQASGSDWARGLEARSCALVRNGEAAEHLYHEAIARLDRAGVRVELARAHLLYGEWLRRQRRRLEARERLRSAHDLLRTIGMDSFAERAARELAATGATARKRAVQTSTPLTPQESQIARLARDGLSNPEIGTRLFISPRTVQYHLRKVFTKLAINSRNELHRVLAADPTTL